MKLKYVYHVYYLTEGNIYGDCGDCTIYRAEKMNTEEEVHLVRKFISERYCNNKNVVICNFILLNKRGK